MKRPGCAFQLMNDVCNLLQGVPFERVRYWSQLAPHPLLQHVSHAAAAGGELLVQTAIGIASLSYLLDHKVGPTATAT